MRQTKPGLAGWLIAAALVLWATAAPAQVREIQGLPADDQPVSLVADQVDFFADTERVIASGSVEIYYGERTLTADRVIYDHRTGRISAEGDIVLRDPTGATVFADMAELDVELTEGLVDGARSVLAEHIRLAAVEARRIDGRYNTLSKAVYSPCRICAEDPTPLWRIRARRIVHDEVERIIHYEDATFDVFGIPIAWLPYFRHPDPTVDRASGFLSPAFENSTNFGYGVEIPYFAVIDDHSDITITPFITTEQAPILLGEYRRLFESGDLRLGGSITFNDFDGEENLRGHVDADGRWDIGAGVDAGFKVKVASDDGYLRFFEIDQSDRLTSELFVERYRDDHFFDATAVRFQSLRDDEPAGQIPIAVPSIDARYELDDPYLGGEFGLFASTNVLFRNNGTDATRLTLGADWERRAVLPAGVALRGFGQVRGDMFLAGDNTAIADSTTTRFYAYGGVEARYPLIWEMDNGLSHVLEPVVQAIAAPYGGNGNAIPVEDSLLVEFDETNVIDENHFSGLDNVEEGPRLNLALRYELLSDRGFGLDASIGRVYRFQAVDAFSEGSGLSGTESDFVMAWRASYDPYVTIRQRLRFSNAATVTRNEVFGTVNVDPVTMEAAYIFLEADPTIGAPVDREEVSARATLGLTDNWSISASMQRDLVSREFVQIGGDIGYVNECCAIEVFLKRRFTDQEDVPASTSVGVRVKLLTLGSTDFGPDR